MHGYENKTQQKMAMKEYNWFSTYNTKQWKKSVFLAREKLK